MKKKELLSLPLPPAPQIDLKTIAPEITMEKRLYGNYEVKKMTRPYTTRIVKCGGENYLELIMYDHTLQPLWRYFHDEKKQKMDRLGLRAKQKNRSRARSQLVLVSIQQWPYKLPAVRKRG